MYIINKNINNIIMDNDQIKKLEKSFDKYKNKIVNMIEKECNDIQPYINQDSSYCHTCISLSLGMLCKEGIQCLQFLLRPLANLGACNIFTNCLYYL